MQDVQPDSKQFPVKQISDWYNSNKRDLPWREINDPYKIWISEIVLQQTRVNQGLQYYNRLVERFPDVLSLANASEDEVLKQWQGLGYYSRARNLRNAAIQIVEQYNGVFPENYNQILSLKGIGKYTAAAIGSIAFGLPYAVVDGNVLRVLSRYFGVDTPVDTVSGVNKITDIANNIIDIRHPGEFNQAIMELGALICAPLVPLCNDCPLKYDCFALKNDMMQTLPVKSKKTTVKHRYFNSLYIRYNGSVFFKKRVKNDVWKNLYEFPLIESDKLFSADELLCNEGFNDLFSGIQEVIIEKITEPVRHVLTHRIIHSCLFVVTISGINNKLLKYLQVREDETDRFPVSRLMENLFEKMMK